MESIKGLKRTNYCGTLTLNDEGKEVIPVSYTHLTLPTIA